MVARTGNEVEVDHRVVVGLDDALEVGFEGNAAQVVLALYAVMVAVPVWVRKRMPA
jgi:hypothetical protein